MLDISQYVAIDEHHMQFTEQQASQFAKGVAGDFNPIHDVGARRFCVPGDLLFSVLLNQFGVYQSLHLDMHAMVDSKTQVKLPNELQSQNQILDTADKLILTLQVDGQNSTDAGFVSDVIQQYVQFSGKTFPDILVELMRSNNCMINPARPMVIYKSMAIELDELNAPDLSLVLDNDNTVLTVDGKKGEAKLQFLIHSNGRIVGRGEKNMVLGGLREFDEHEMSDIVAQYAQWKNNYSA